MAPLGELFSSCSVSALVDLESSMVTTSDSSFFNSLCSDVCSGFSTGNTGTAAKYF